MAETTDDARQRDDGRSARGGSRRARVLAAAGAVLLALLAAGTCALPPAGLPPPARHPPPGATTVVASAAARYDGSLVRRWMLGDGYRDLWAAPISVEVLDLHSTAGGLTPVRPGGGNQTRSLHLLGADGRRYAFRSVDKDQGGDLPPISRATIGRARQDQVSALHPAGALVASGLARAAGVPHAPPRLLAMPDDPALGPYRRRFAGMLGMLEEYPPEPLSTGPAFLGSRHVVDTEDLDSALASTPGVRVDTAGYLAARLLDVLLNDWDRHPGQWRWARLERGGSERWVAIPRDRDYALVDYRGLIPRAARIFDPKVVRLDGRYRDLRGLLVEARGMDARFLCSLPPASWDSVAGALRDSLDDRALSAAVRRIPAGYVRRDGARLLRILRERRDALPAAARRFRTLLHDDACGAPSGA